MVLTAIVPIKNFNQNRDSISKIISQAGVTLGKIRLVFVLDSPAENDLSDLNSLINHSGLEKAVVISVSCNNPGGARNYGLRHATSDWVTFWDCDDLPNSFNTLEMIEFAQTKQLDFCFGSFITRDLKDNSIYEYKYPSLISKFEISINPGIWRFVFSRDFLKDNSFPELKLGEDQVFIANCISKSLNFQFFDRQVYQYYQGRYNSITSSKLNQSDLLKSAELIFFQVKYANNSSKIYLNIIYLKLCMTRLTSFFSFRNLMHIIKIIFFSKYVMLNLFSIVIIFATLVLRKKLYHAT